MPPKPRQNGCRQVLLHWTFSDERLNHWHHIHDSVLTWCPCAGSTYILASRQRSQRVDVEDSTIVSWQTNLQPLFASKMFCELHFFYVGAIECWCSLDKTAVRSNMPIVLMDRIFEIWTVCKCFCPWTHFHKSTSALCNASFGQFRLRKVEKGWMQWKLTPALTGQPWKKHAMTCMESVTTLMSTCRK